MMERKTAAINAEIDAKLKTPLKILDGVALKGTFGLPKGLRDQIEAETRIMTIANPVFMH